MLAVSYCASVVGIFLPAVLRHREASRLLREDDVADGTDADDSWCTALQTAGVVYIPMRQLVDGSRSVQLKQPDFCQEAAAKFMC